MWEIWVRYSSSTRTFSKLTGGFPSARAAMEWLMIVYTADAGFWTNVGELRILEKKA